MRSRKTAKDLAGNLFDPHKRYRPDSYYAPSATIYKQNTREQDHHETNAEHMTFWTLVAKELQSGLLTV